MPDDPQLDALKLPPHSLEAEQSILGGLLLDNEAADRIGDVVTEDDFYSDAHRLVYAHIVKLVATSTPAVTPDARNTFAAPRLPLPTRRKSLAPHRRASSSANGTEPMQ